MNLYLISQDKNNNFNTNFDIYDSAVVCADTKDNARMMHPNKNDDWDGEDEENSTWCAAKDVEVSIIGYAVDNSQRGVVCASYNAG